MPEASDERYEWPPRPEAALDPDESERLAGLVSGARGAIVIGSWPGQLSGIDHVWSEMVGWPIVAEPISGSRRPGACLAAGQALIGSEWASAHRPEVLIQFGAAPTTRTTQAFVASADKVVVADRFHLDPDPERVASWRLAVDPDALGGVLGRHPLVQQGIGIALTVTTRMKRSQSCGGGGSTLLPTGGARSGAMPIVVARSRHGRRDGRVGRAVRATRGPRRGGVGTRRRVPLRRELDARPRPRSRDGPSRRPPRAGQPGRKRDRRPRVHGARRGRRRPRSHGGAARRPLVPPRRGRAPLERAEGLPAHDRRR